jgi:membrane fusion protein (multidrug efflux system)
VTAEVGGKVTSIDVPEGRRVKKGHVLARLDASGSAADLAVAKAELGGARDTLSRTEALFKEKLVAAQQVDQAKAAEDVAASEVRRRATSLQKTVVVAPFDGVVGIRRVSVGAYVSPGAPITQLTSMDALELVFTVPERFVPDLRVGQRVRGVVGNCTNRFDAKMVVLEPAVDPQTRTLRALALVDAPPASLRPGMSASVRIEIEEAKNVLAVPQEAVIRSGSQQYLFVITEDGQAKRKNVELGQIDATRVEVTDGLAAGERVITSGHQKLKSGAAVDPKPYEAVENPNLVLGLPREQADCWF